MSKKIVILGSNFAGFTAAIEIRKKLGAEHEVVVFSNAEEFLFLPSLIWVPFGLREKEDISFPVRPVFEQKGIRFVHAPVSAIRLDERQVVSSTGTESYDFLVIATGPKLNYQAIPGLGPKHGFTQSIFSWPDAEQARRAFERFLEKPGPVVVGAVQGASCFGAAYEFLFNMAHQLRKRGIDEPITYVTAEPYLGHFGMGGFGPSRALTERFFDKQGIRAETNAAVREITADAIRLEDGRDIRFSYAMLAPPFLGIDAVRECKEITNDLGFVRVDDAYRTDAYPEVFAAGVAVAVAPPEPTPVPCGAPKTGYLSEEMAKVVAHNVAASIDGQPLVELPPGSIDAKCVLDAGGTGIIMTSDRYFEPRKHAWLIPGPEAHWAKLAFEKYFLATRSRGYA